MNRAQVIHIISAARTHEEVTHAQRVRDEWIKLHPDDDEVFDISESLNMMAEAHARIAAGIAKQSED